MNIDRSFNELFNETTVLVVDENASNFISAHIEVTDAVAPTKTNKITFHRGKKWAVGGASAALAGLRMQRIWGYKEIK